MKSIKAIKVCLTILIVSQSEHKFVAHLGILVEAKLFLYNSASENSFGL
jgi:hypothetical protein